MYSFNVQGSANPRTPGLVNFVIAVAYHFCLNLLRAFSQPGARGLADPCNVSQFIYLIIIPFKTSVHA